MKKALAISLLVIGNMAAVLALSLIYYFVFPLIFNLAFTILIGLAAVTALAFASSRLFSVFKRKYRLNSGLFVLASYIPPVIGAAGYWIVYLILDAAGYFKGKGWFADVPGAFFGLFLGITAMAYLISGDAWVSSVTSRSNANRSPK